MKVLIIGGVAAGTKVAAKIKREDRSCEVTILTKGKDISYAGCGLPYYVGSVIPSREQLIVNTPESFSKLTGALVQTETEVTDVDPVAKTVTAIHNGESAKYSYDKLVIASGASPFRPQIDGLDLENVFFMRTPDDAIALREAVEAGGIKRAVVAGGGFIGLEVAENLAEKGVRVNVIDFAPHVLPNFLDPEMSEYVENKMADAGINPMTGVALEAILGEGKVQKVQTSKRAIKADAVILAIGIRPNTSFLEGSGIEMFKGTILTDKYLRTNVEDIYAVGDCAMVTNRETSKPAWSPMGSTANIAGRVLAGNICGGSKEYAGVLGTGVAKLPGGLNTGRTGLTETAAKEAGYDVITALSVVDDKAHYYPGAGSFIIKMVADKNTRKFLGLQVLGTGAVDKVTDIAVTAISLDATVDQLENLDFAYAPPFSTAIHPFAHALNILLNKMSGAFDSMTPVEFAEGAAEDYRIVDVSPQPSIPTAPYMDLSKINGEVEGFGKDEKLLLICAKGKRAYMTQNRLKYYGYTNTKALEGGLTFNTLKEED
ncbi:MAG: FAD-dependent oxidoreductase [Lachnospiraceae bacterium]|jgi:NADPH-dependent 2,4-dienoyl-CoA reductase/sulfur reductase-like enzyme/rhodanese-related sulfurtransferase|nr:FAD-dependent oxidoreductase [Lachnospiraceae bacterium]